MHLVNSELKQKYSIGNTALAVVILTYSKAYLRKIIEDNMERGIRDDVLMSIQ